MMKIGRHSEQIQYTLPSQFQEKLGLSICNPCVLLDLYCSMYWFTPLIFSMSQLTWWKQLCLLGDWIRVMVGMILLCCQNHHRLLARWSSRSDAQMAADGRVLLNQTRWLRPVNAPSTYWRTTICWGAWLCWWFKETELTFIPTREEKMI